MKLKVKIDGQFYDVDVGNLSERPIKAVIDGETFEVWPEGNLPYVTSATVQKQHKETITELVKQPSPLPVSEGKATSPTATAPQSDLLTTVKAPIPGVITAILVQPGAEVSIGQELCKLEAMKMNNSIRSSRAGKIAAIHVSIGQHVKHNDLLIEFVG